VYAWQRGEPETRARAASGKQTPLEAMALAVALRIVMCA
jgi:hypothetical protein